MFWFLNPKDDSPNLVSRPDPNKKHSDKLRNTANAAKKLGDMKRKENDKKKGE